MNTDEYENLNQAIQDKIQEMLTDISKLEDMGTKKVKTVWVRDNLFGLSDYIFNLFLNESDKSRVEPPVKLVWKQGHKSSKEIESFDPYRKSIV